MISNFNEKSWQLRKRKKSPDRKFRFFSQHFQTTFFECSESEKVFLILDGKSTPYSVVASNPTELVGTKNVFKSLVNLNDRTTKSFARELKN